MVEYSESMIKTPIVIDNVSSSVADGLGIRSDEGRTGRWRQANSRVQLIVSELMI